MAAPLLPLRENSSSVKRLLPLPDLATQTTLLLCSKVWRLAKENAVDTIGASHLGFDTKNVGNR